MTTLIYKVSLAKIMKDFKLETVYLPKDAEEIFINSTEVNRPSLQLAGFFNIFDPNRLQILGKTEMAYIATLEEAILKERLAKLFSLLPAVVIVTCNLEIPQILIDAAGEGNVAIMRTSENTCDFMSALIAQLNIDLGLRKTIHGVFLEMFGDGVLILGESGVGKSEVAVELMMRGHCLVADDAVEVRKVSSKVIVGSSPENIRHFMELRGIGVINAQRMLGMRAVKISEKILLVVKLEPWDNEKAYDRLGLENETMDILGIEIPCITIPVKPGRNLASIIEVATMNLRLKKLGYSAPHDLMKGLGMPEDELPQQQNYEVSGYWQ